MFALRNSSETVLDLVETVFPVKKNQFGCIVPCRVDDAEGYLGSNGNILVKEGNGLKDDYASVHDAIMVEDIPKYVKPFMYKYGTAWADGVEDAEEKFYLNEDEYVDSIENLTQRVAMLEEMVMELSKGVYEHE